MIKSTKLTTKYINQGKHNNLTAFLQEYKLVVKQFIDILWERETIPKLLPQETTSLITTWLSVRAIQCAGKQASGIVRGTRKKQEKRKWVYEKLQSQGHHKKARKLNRIIQETKITKPNINQIEPELDSRFVKMDFPDKTTFDGWITLGSLGNKLKIIIPVKKTKHFNKLQNKGKLKTGLRLSSKNITLNFDIPDVAKKTQGETIGLDIGIKNVFTLSTGIVSNPDSHGHTLDTITQKLSRKTKGSKAFERTQQHRKNHINWALNQIDFSNIKTLKIENIKHLRKYKRSSRYLSHFTYTEIFSKIQDLTASEGVLLEKINPTYTSQRCSNCGWVRKGNRKGKQFKCGICKFSLDSDLNASRNISLDLRPISSAQRLLHKNRKGFYWNSG